MTQTRSIKISYDLQPPEEASVGTNLSTFKSYAFPVPATNTSDLKEYYTALRESLAAAKNQVGDDLTEWRDAVGKLELSKESKPPKKGVELDDDEEEEEEEEEE
ncbi:hypothetical protein BXZ70DRAFT_352168 [Cristinia sonorae]|uniref:EKC/KEOPS complex subunit GON7 n=1 Tax=Cristinia sonorae TaxID=1940300 RepID=A0A8K0UK79_9AGAR|nr:hypothetical protein BXZ70DRAFT_352168 [Cristinia sonorae]